jgi:hypothetical protein
MTPSTSKAVNTINAMARLAPQNNQPSLTNDQHRALSAELKSIQRDNDALLDCLRQITRATKIRGPLGTLAYVINDDLIAEAMRLVGDHS